MAEPEVFYTYDNYNDRPEVSARFNTKLEEILSRNLDSPYDIDTNEETRFDKYDKQLKNASCTQPKNTSGVQLLAQQKFIPKYINERTPYRGLLVWHGLGSGKSCTAISVSNHFEKKKVVIVPAALVDNFIGDYKICGPQPLALKPESEPEYIPASPQYEYPLLGGSKVFTKFTQGITDDEAKKTEFITFTSNGNLNKYRDSDADHFEDKLIIIDESQLTIEHIANALQNRTTRMIQYLANIAIIDIIRRIYPDELSFSNQQFRGEEPPPELTPTQQRSLTRMIERAREKIMRSTLQQNQNLFGDTVKDIQSYLNAPYIKFYNCLKSLEKSKIICLSGTPIVKTPLELAVLFNIIHGDIVYWQVETPNGTFESLNNAIDIINNIDYANSVYENNGVRIMKIYKNPYNFINKNPQSRDGEIIYNNSGLSKTNKDFEALLKRRFGDDAVKIFRIPFFDDGPNFAASFEKQYPLNEIPRKINGLVSYFGNIEKIMPNVVLKTDLSANLTILQVEQANYETCNSSEGEPDENLNAACFLRNNNLYKYGIGKGNNYNDLYEVRFVNSSPLLKMFDRIRVIPGDDHNHISILNALAKDIGLSTQSHQFIYPGTAQYIKDRLHTDPLINRTDLPRIPYDGLNQTQKADLMKRTIIPFIREMPEHMAGMEVIQHVWEYASFATQPVLINGTKTIKKAFDIYEYDYYYSTEITSLPEKDDPSFNLFNDNSYNLLQLCSPKIYEIVKCIKENPTKLHIIYSEYLQLNIPLARALQANGFDEFTGKNLNEGALNNKRYMFYTGTSEYENEEQKTIENSYGQFLINNEGKSEKNRDILLKGTFNQDDNKYGEKVQVIIINSAAAEGITIKNVSYVHLLHLPANMSKLFQIIGRAIRNCTHVNLKKDEQTVTPILYLSDNQEIKYREIIDINQRNIPYLNVIKQSTIDCLYNKKMDASLNCFINSTEPFTPMTGVWQGYRTLCEAPPGISSLRPQLPVVVPHEQENDAANDEVETNTSAIGAEGVFVGAPEDIPIIVEQDRQNVMSPTQDMITENTTTITQSSPTTITQSSPIIQTSVLTGKRPLDKTLTPAPRRSQRIRIKGGTKKTKPIKKHKTTIQRNKKTKKRVTKKHQRDKKRNKHTIRN
jgi:hypothetical protein